MTCCAVPIPGCVDEHDQAWTGGEGDDGSKGFCRLLASEGNSLEALLPSDALLDAGAGLVEGAGEEGLLVLFIGFVGDHRGDTALPPRLSVGIAGMAFAADDGSGLNIGADVEQAFEVPPIGGLAAGQSKGDDIAGSVGLGLSRPGQATAGAAECLSVLPPFAPAADTGTRMIVESNF